MAFFKFGPRHGCTTEHDAPRYGGGHMHACLRRRGWQPKAHCVYPSKEPARCSVLCLCDGRETFAVTDAGADERLKMTPSSLGCCLLLVPSFHPPRSRRLCRVRQEVRLLGQGRCHPGFDPNARLQASQVLRHRYECPLRGPVAPSKLAMPCALALPPASALAKY